ncbi:glycosyltransferase family 2 protein [Tepidicaulis sp. LMO-SS28]|uniref:glycosyltransferase family 2 protein n=1 Tax=Tepidicaulis sp. LMO-SS28 TaxID=3447455 RepID=UPI003EE32DDF
MSAFRPCLIVPAFNHGISARALTEAAAPLGLPVFLVDDGSTLEQEALQEAANAAHVTLIRRGVNGGKGAAVMTGLEAAHEAGFTHALQIDADGQHDSAEIPGFLEAAKTDPGAMIAGAPRYDESVPRIRLIARYLTHVWVWIETLSFDIEDAMCGFRVYPLEPVMRILQTARPGRRMDFDPEILVRLHWAGVPVRARPARVIYPEGGRSNFRLFADNGLITLMHTRLFFGMLRRLPMLLARKAGRT